MGWHYVSDLGGVQDPRMGGHLSEKDMRVTVVSRVQSSPQWWKLHHVWLCIVLDTFPQCSTPSMRRFSKFDNACHIVTMRRLGIIIINHPVALSRCAGHDYVSQLVSTGAPGDHLGGVAIQCSVASAPPPPTTKSPVIPAQRVSWVSQASTTGEHNRISQRAWLAHRITGLYTAVRFVFSRKCDT